MEKELNDEHLVLLKVLFLQFDEECNDKLPAGIFARAVHMAFNSIGELITLAQAQAITEQYNDGTGYYSFDKFVTILTGKMVQIYTRPEMLKLFRVMDKEHKGFITVEEMRQKFGDRLTEDEIQCAVRCGDGILTFEAFYTLMNPFKN
ncbi:calmodulin-like [Teleopsis dalmanni]|uniref:calmodulin-like n=1 Tax=Teleopsis dalmanni TaxID=139649 RepID=UPI0018CE87D3|nr:calmodulin-like [Teleopsis dalmanni]